MTRLVDDIDGSDAVETLSFSLDGRSYEIDLSETHLDAFRQAVAPFVTAARLVATTRGVSHGRRPAPAVTPEPTPEPTPEREPEPKPVPATARPAALDVVPFHQPPNGREVAARPARSTPAPLVADPFNPRP